jgi:hypothetical protein
VLTVLRELIGNDSISLTDDFYLVGGHSLLILRIVKRLREEFGIHLDARYFGVSSQIAALVAACETLHDRGGGAGRTDRQAVIDRHEPD